MDSTSSNLASGRFLLNLIWHQMSQSTLKGFNWSYETKILCPLSGEQMMISGLAVSTWYYCH